MEPQNMQKKSEITPAYADLDAATAGEQLRMEMESQGRTVADVAEELRLDRRIIEALHDDDYAKLPAPIFTKGYLRNYAVLLGIDPVELSKRYDRDSGVTEPKLLVDPLAGEGAGGSALARWFFALVAILLIGGGIWWYVQPVEEPRTASEQAENLVAELPAPGEVLQPGQQRSLATANTASPAGANNSSNGANGAANTGASNTANNAAANTASNTNTTATNRNSTNTAAASNNANAWETVASDSSATNSTASNASQQGQAASRNSNEPTAAERIAAIRAEEAARAEAEAAAKAAAAAREAAAAAALAADGKATLEIALKQDSWVSIRDADGERLIRDLLRGGTKRNFRGTPPFQVMLGYSEGVQVLYNGEEFDHKPFQKQNLTARFELGSASN